MSAPWHKKKGVTIQATKLNGITVQSSVYGRAIAKGWGTYRVAGNLLWYGAFTAYEQKQRAGGKGGGGKVTSISYTYSASFIMAICAGPIAGITAVYKDQSTYVAGEKGTPLQQAGLSLVEGEIGQEPWDYLVTNFPDEALGYSGICYAYAANYDLGAAGTLGNHSFEVASTTRVGDLPDANPKDILSDFVQSVPFWAPDLIDETSLEDYSDYCLSANLLLSPVLDDQRQASDFIGEILQATNSEIIISGGKLKIVPYGDAPASGNGTSWTPNLTPVYDLTDDDFIPPGNGEDPVEVDITRTADAYNYIQVEYLDRDHQYNTNVVPGIDQASIDQYGRRQNQSPYQLHSICDSTVANTVAQLIVQRTSNVRAKYSFRLPASYALLEPMDLVTLTSGDLDRVLVRITQIDEVVGDGDIADELQVEAEQMLVGTADAASYSRQGTGGYRPNPDVDPGGIDEYALVCPPRQLTNGDYEVWVGAAGLNTNWGGAEVWVSLDDENYEYVGQVNARARLGFSSSLPVGTDPDTTHTIDVDLGTSGGTLLDATQSDVDNAITLCLLGTELIAYRDSAVVAPFTYELSYLRRGLYGTTIESHPDNETFIRLDETFARIPYAAEQVGSTFYVKLLSFNFLERATKSLDEVPAYSIILEPGAAPVVDIISEDTKNVAGRPSSYVLQQIDEALQKAATIQAELDVIQNEVDEALVLVDQALQKAQEILGLTEKTGASIIQNALTALDLRNIANGWTSLDGERITVPVEYGKRIDSLLGEISDDGSALILNRETVWVSPTQSFAGYELQIQSDFDSQLALINLNYSTLASADEALASMITTLGVQVDANVAAISTEATTRANEDSALAASISTLTATVGDNTASINTLSIAQADDRSTFSAQISTLTSSYNSLNSTVTSNYSTLSSQDSAIASAVIGTSATLNGQTTSVYLTAASVATITGQLYSSLTFKLGGNGALASMQLMTSSGAIDMGAAVFDVGSFFIKSSSNPAIAPFFYDATTGTLFLETITVRRANIQVAAIDTLQLAGGSVSGVVAGENASPMNLSTGVELTHLYYGYAASGGQIVVNVYGEIGTTSNNVAGAVLNVYCDGILIGTGSIYCPGSWGGVGLSVPMKHQPSAGSHTYSVTYTGTPGSNGTYRANRSVIVITELKR